MKQNKHQLIKLNLACGDHIYPNYINIDKYHKTADIMMDLESFPWDFNSNYADEILIEHFLEHISDINSFFKEIFRVLKPNGINIYTVRHTKDGDYKNGIHRGEDLYEKDGFIVHFFSEKKVKSLLKYNYFPPPKTIPYFLKRYDSVDIDNKEDLKFAEFLFKFKKNL